MRTFTALAAGCCMDIWIEKSFLVCLHCNAAGWTDGRADAAAGTEGSFCDYFHCASSQITFAGLPTAIQYGGMS